MACPYFLPSTPWDSPSIAPPARAPLGRVYSGDCHSGPVPKSPPDDVLRDLCNFGYGRRLCPWFPADAGYDAVRFSYRADELIFVGELEGSPIASGPVAPSSANSILTAQARAFTETIAVWKNP